MASPVKFLFFLVLTSIVGWLVFMFASRLIAWLMGRVLGAVVQFRIAGCNCLRDISIKFNKGALESVSVSEIKLSLRKSLVKLGVGFIHNDPKLQLLICDLEVFVRQSEKKPKKASSKKPHSNGKGKLMVLANMARFLSVSISELVLKTPKVIVQAKELGLDLFKSDGLTEALSVKLQLSHFFLLMGESRLGNDRLGCLLDRQASTNSGKDIAPFMCNELSVTCKFVLGREMGITITGLDVDSGDIIVNLSEDLFHKTKTSSDASCTEIKGNLEASPAMKEKNAALSINKHLHLFPEKVSFNLPKLDARFMHQSQNLFVENTVTGIQLGISRSIASDDSGESLSHFDVQIDFSEIHILREGQSSVVEILKVVVITSVDLPLQPNVPIRAEIDIKIGGAQINVIVSRLVPLLGLKQSNTKKMTLREKDASREGSSVVKAKAFTWTCTVSAPEMVIVLYNVKGLPLYHACSQSSHIYMNNTGSKGMEIHAELGELHLKVADKHQECLQEFGVEASTDSLVHIARVSLDWGFKEMEPRENHGANKSKLVLSIDVTGMGIYFSFLHVESLITTAMSFKAILRSLSKQKNTHDKAGRSSGKASKGVQVIKLNLGQCSMIFSGDVGVEDAVVADPKRVNYGSQGGEIVFTMSADGTPRKACITSTVTDGSKLMRNSICLDVIQLNLLVNKEKKSTRVEFQRVRSFYKEYLEEQYPCTNVNLLDIQNAKIVQRLGGAHETSICSLFGASNIALRWEPDVHVALNELILRVKFIIHRENARNFSEAAESLERKDAEPRKELAVDLVPSDKQHRKKESVFAVDVETLKVSAELADGVEVVAHVQSIFSENARIGILLEGLSLIFNDCRVIRSSRMQISRLPVLQTNTPDVKVQSIIRWDWVIQGLDIHICLPYRLQLRAIDDAVEDTLRGLKLVLAAKTNIIFPVKKDSPKKIKSKESKFGSVRFNIRKITADIEEEPLQGWLDEHYYLLKSEVCEMTARMMYLDDIVSEGTKQLNAEQNEVNPEKKFRHDGVDIDAVSIQSLREEIHERTFKSYYATCQKISYSEGSGACSSGFQSGFKPSKQRASLLSILATDLDVTLTGIEGGDSGMIEFIKKLDPVALDHNIPFSRLYGRNVVLHTGSLVVQLRDYPFPLFSGTVGSCEGCIVLAQQATCFQPQIEQDVYVGRWRKVRMLRSASGTTPAVKTYSDLPLIFQKGEVCFGVGFEPVFADVSYAFTVALRRANLSTRSYDPNFKSLHGPNQPPKKERSLPWWDDMRYYIHGKISLSFAETRWIILASANPYEKLNKLEVISGCMDIQQSDGHVSLSAKDFKVLVSSLDNLIRSRSLNEPLHVSVPFLECPSFSIEIEMEWGCDSSNPLNHYLHALPVEGELREKVLDPFRSTSLSLKWVISLRSSQSSCNRGAPSTADDGSHLGQVHGKSQKSENIQMNPPTINLGAHDLGWIVKFWNLNFLPPHKLRTFSRWPRFGVPRVARSGNLSLDRVMTEFFLRFESTPTCIQHVAVSDDDPARGLTIKMEKVKMEHCLSRGKQHFTFECKREPLDPVYQGLDLHLLKIFFNKETGTVIQAGQAAVKSSQSVDKINNEKEAISGHSKKGRDAGFLLYAEYFTIRKQSPKADPERLQPWQDSGKKNLEAAYYRSEFDNDSDSDHTRSDPSDGEDDGYNVVVADNCQRVFVHGLKILWNIDNRNAVSSWAGGLAKAFEPPKPSPSRQYAQRKLIEEQQKCDDPEASQDDLSESNPSAVQDETAPSEQNEVTEAQPSGSPSIGTEDFSSDITAKNGFDDDEEGTQHFMVNVVQPQFNLHSEEANGRFLLAAASGRVLARSFHSVVQVGYEAFEKTLGAACTDIPESAPQLTWKRAELSVMLEEVQSHVAPTDVDPGAGIQWLPKILRSSPKVKRTSALLERVFMPCQMYFRYTRHKHDSAERKLKPLKELNFNSPNITASMTSRQFQVMLDVLTNLLFARFPKPQNNSIALDDEDGEEADEVVPDGIEEVELAKIKLEQNERERRLLLYDIRNISASNENLDEPSPSSGKESDLWMISSGKTKLVQCLKNDFVREQKLKKEISVELRMALQKAAQLRLMEKEKNKSPSFAMRVSVRINKVVWSMLADNKPFAEAEINDVAYDFDRDYKDIGLAKFTTKSIEVKNWLPNSKTVTLLSPWNAPADWGKKAMLRVDAKQGAPREGISLLELFQVEIYPLKIHLTETMYRRMWGYFFPEEEQDSHRRQEVWKVSTTAGAKRGKKLISGIEVVPVPRAKEYETPAKTTTSATTSSGIGVNLTSSHASKQQQKATAISKPELRRTSSLDRTWEENVAESVANELVLQAQSSSTKNGPLGSAIDEEALKVKSKDSKMIKSGARLAIEEKKVGKSQDEKKTRTKKMIEFSNIKISQVELLVTYEGSRFAVSELRLLMDSFHRVDFTGTWGRLFSRVKKHIIWGVLKSVTGMQGKKFKVKSQSQKDSSAPVVPDIELNFSDSDGDQPGKSDQNPVSWPKRPNDGAGDGFVTSIKGLFSTQRRKAKKFVLSTMRGGPDNEFHGEWSENEGEFTPFARQLTITKAKKLIRHHTKKFNSKGSKEISGTASEQKGSQPSSPKDTSPYESDSSGDSSPMEAE